MKLGAPHREAEGLRGEGVRKELPAVESHVLLRLKLGEYRQYQLFDVKT